MKHHSLADWDFQPRTWVYLSKFLYVSGPSSLAIPQQDTGYYEAVWAFLKEHLGKRIPHGKLVTWIWLGHDSTNTPRFFFRAQGLPSEAGGYQYPDNCYFIDPTYSYTGFWKRVNKKNSRLVYWWNEPQLRQRLWHKIALTWETVETINGTRFAFSFDILEGETWIQQILWYDTANLWETSEVNRVGFIISGAGDPVTRNSAIDDTEIYRRIG